ncbi:MAG: secretin N-terminal domain-containing protein, partial [Planctomycetota bacterium]
GSIIALASPEMQDEIALTVAKLQESDAAFEVIPLRTVDPIFAISLIEEMLALDGFGDEEDGEEPPKIDADPGNRRLFVRGKPQQIEQVRQIVSGLEDNPVAATTGLTVLPVNGMNAIESLKTAAKFWRDPNPILLLPSESGPSEQPAERAIGDRVPMPVRSKSGRRGARPGASRQETQSGKLAPGVESALREFDEGSSQTLTSARAGRESSQLLTSSRAGQAPMIRCQLTPRGLILQSDDSQALSRFEQHLQTIMGPMESRVSPPTIFYLSYAKSNDALRMLAELFDGGQAAREGEAGTLVNGYVSGAGSYLGSIIVSRDGTMTMMVGSITVVADPRLNRLIAQGTSADLQQIESFLRIIDKDTSLATDRTYGTSRVIELLHTEAADVAAAISTAFASRIQTSGNTAVPAKGGQAVDPRAAEKAKSKGREDDGDAGKSAKRGSNASSADSEPKMTIAVHEQSNSLIVTAPDQLFNQVQELAMSIDQRSERVIEVITPSSQSIDAILASGILGGSTLDTPTSSSRARAPTANARPKTTERPAVRK